MLFLKTVVYLLLFPVLVACTTSTRIIPANEIQNDIFLASAALAVYEDNKVKRDMQKARIGQIEELEFYGQAQTKPLGITSEFLIWKRENPVELILAFAGTNNDLDADNNFDSKLIEVDGITYKFHNGYVRSWQEVQELVQQKLKEFGGNEINIRVTGHSKGGAVAIIAGHDLYQKGYRISKVVTFAAPPVIENMLPPTNTPNALRKHIQDSSVLSRLNATSTHYIRESDIVQGASSILFQSQFNLGKRLIIRDTGYIKQKHFGYEPITEVLGDPDSLAKTLAHDIGGHAMNRYLRLLKAAHDFQYVSSN